jgi:hypothetical protein
MTTVLLFRAVSTFAQAAQQGFDVVADRQAMATQ